MNTFTIICYRCCLDNYSVARWETGLEGLDESKPLDPCLVLSVQPIPPLRVHDWIVHIPEVHQNLSLTVNLFIQWTTRQLTWHAARSLYNSTYQIQEADYPSTSSTIPLSSISSLSSPTGACFDIFTADRIVGASWNSWSTSSRERFIVSG